MDGEGRAGAGEGGQLLALRHRGAPGARAGEDDGLAHPGEGELALEGGGRGGVSRDAGGHVVGDSECAQPPHLLPDRPVEGRVARVHAGNVLAVRVRRLHLVDDLVEGHGGGIEHPGALRRAGDDFRRHERARVEDHRARLDEAPAAHRDELGVARTGPDEVDGHGAPPPACESAPEFAPASLPRGV